MKLKWSSGVIFLFLFLSGRCYSYTWLYVPNSGLDSLSAICNSNSSIFYTIDTGSESAPYGVAVSPDGNYTYLTNNALTGKVFVVRASDMYFCNTINVGGSPKGVAVSPDSKNVYVANFNDNTVSVIDAETNEVDTTVYVGQAPCGIAVHPSGSYVFVTNSADDTMSILDADNNYSPSEPVPVGDTPKGIAVNQEGTYVYVANYGDNTVSVINTEDDTVSVSVGNGPFGIAVSPDGDKVYVTNSLDNTVSVIDAENNIVEKTIPTGNVPMGISVPRNGNTAYVINYSGESINAINISDDTVTEFCNTGSGSAPVGLGQFVGGFPPAAPTNLDIDCDDTTVELTWDDNSYNEIGFKIERKKYGKNDTYYEQVGTADANNPCFSESGLSENTSYYYRVKAYNEAADSDSNYCYKMITTGDNDDDDDEEEDNDSTCFITSVMGHV